MSREFTVIETQEQLDAIIANRINALNQKHSEATAGLQSQIDSLTAEKSALVDEAKANGETIASLQGEVDGYKLNALKTKIARENGLTYEAVQFLNGQTEEEIKANCEALAALLPKPSHEPSHEPDYVPNPNQNNLNKWLKSMKEV